MFAGLNYYPDGGWGDFVDSYDTLDEAIKAGRRKTNNRVLYRTKDWFHVVDLQSGEIVHGH